MPLLNDTYCQFCERFITKQQWNTHLCSSGHLHKEVNRCWPSYFQQRKLTAYEASVLEQAFSEMSFGSEDVLPVFGFLKTYFKMVTNLTDYVKDNDDDDDVKDDFGYYYRDIMIAQLKQGFCNKNLSLQDQNKCDEKNTLQRKIKVWLHVIDWGDQHLVLFMIKIITTLEWIIIFAGKRHTLTLKNFKELLGINDSENKRNF